jgi:hypothetical protein
VKKRSASSRPPSGKGRKGGATEEATAAPRRGGKARQRRRGKRHSIPSALITGTSGEYLGLRPLPRALRQRPLVVICGPRGVGKTSVARILAGDKARRMDDRGLHQAIVWRVREQQWSKALRDVLTLIIDGPVFLGRRPGAASMVAGLLQQRVDAGLRTVIVEGPVADGSVEVLMDAVAPEHRATLTLRFPVEGGRLRFAQRVCQELGLDRALARNTLALQPWSYVAVRQALEAGIR